MDGWDGWMEWNGWMEWMGGWEGWNASGRLPPLCRKSDFGLSKIRLRSVENQTPLCRKSDSEHFVRQGSAQALSKIRLRLVENQTTACRKPDFVCRKSDFGD